MAFIDPASGIFRIGDQLFEFEGGSQQAANLRVISPQDIQNRFMTTAVTAGMTPQQFIQQEPDITTNPEAARRAGIGDVNAGYSSIGDILQAANKASPSTELARATQDYKNAEAKGSVGGSTTNRTSGNTSGGASGSSGTAGGYTRDSKGNVFDGSGNHLTLEQTKTLGPNGGPLNLVNLPMGGFTLDPSTGKTTQGSTDPNAWADQRAIDGLKFQFGWTDEQAKAFIASSPTEAKQWALTGEYLKNQADLSQAKTATNAQELAAAHQKALAELNDPTSALGQKYQDLDKTNLANFQTNLEAIRTSTSTQQAQQQIDFNNQRLAQANAAASSGTAYSGFRERAKQELGTQQSGIVQSSLSSLKQNLQSQFQPLEQFYGSSQFAKMFANNGVNFTDPTTGQSQNIAYNQVGNLTGTQALQKQADVNQETQNLYGVTATS